MSCVFIISGHGSIYFMNEMTSNHKFFNGIWMTYKVITSEMSVIPHHKNIPLLKLIFIHIAHMGHVILLYFIQFEHNNNLKIIFHTRNTFILEYFNRHAKKHKYNIWYIIWKLTECKLERNTWNEQLSISHFKCYHIFQF